MAPHRVLVAALFAVLVALLTPGVASAHSELLESNPAADSTVAELPDEVLLTFNQDIEEAFSTVTLTDASGTNWIPDAPTVAGPQVRARIDGAAPPGAYTIAYRVLSADGHPISDSFTFTFTPDRISGPGEAATAPATTAPAETTQARDDAATQSDTSNRTLTWLFGAAAAGLAVAGIFVMLRGRRGRD